MQLKYFLIGLELVLSGSLIQAQTSMPRNYIPPSPTAANLGLYTTVPVNHYTGVPDISIPLAQVQIKNLDLNIGLSYHIGAVRKADEASWVGLGWSLNAGGVITRTKRHKDDLSVNGFYKINPSTRPCNDEYDQEPDLFFFNFAGRTGKFFIESIANNLPKIRALTKDMLKITLTVNGDWQITDENGVGYQFSAKEYMKDVYASPGKSETETFVSSWYLTKVTNAYSESIDLSYLTTGNKIYKKMNFTTYRELVAWTPDYLFSSNVMFGDVPGLTKYTQLAGRQVAGVSTSETYCDEVLLKSITYAHGSIEFETSDRLDLMLQNNTLSGKKLDKIVIKSAFSNGNPILKSFRLGYDYFTSYSAQSNQVSKRLQLNYVTELSDYIIFPPYKFTYTTNVLPDKANSTNYGGFLTDVSQGLLNKIVYPTGGFSLFTYEPNVNNIGARIKRIEQKDPETGTGIKVYEYIGGKKLSNSVAISIGGPELLPLDGTMAGYPQASTVHGTLQYSMYCSSDQCMMGESSSDYLVGYDKVIEYSGDNGENGKSSYEFKNIASSPVIGVPADVSVMNGFLQIKEDFSNKNGVYVSLKKMVRECAVENISTTTSKRLFQTSCTNTYSLKSEWLKLTSETEYNYDNGSNPVILAKTYSYGNTAHVLPTKVGTKDSKGNLWETNYKYPADMSLLDVGGVYTKMVNRNMTAPIIEETKLQNGIFISSHKINYREWAELAPYFLAPETEDYKNGSNLVDTKLRYYKYDLFGNPLELSKENDSHTAYLWDYKSTYPVAKVISAENKLIAHTSCEAEDGQHAYFIQQLAIISTDALTGNKSLNLSDPSCASSSAISFQVRAPGNYTFSIWSKNGTACIKGIGLMPANNFTLCLGPANKRGATLNGWSYYEADLNLNSTLKIEVSGSGLVDEIRLFPPKAQMTTYTYEPERGITSICDPNNRIIYYEYDKIGRLIYIKDENKNILKKFCYNYKGQVESCFIFQSIDVSGTYYSQTCRLAQIPAAINITVPAKKFTSGTSQEDADNQARQYAQNLANQTGTCQVQNMTLNYNNSAGAYGYTVELYNTTTGASYSFQVGSGSGVLGTVLEGNYNIYIYSYGDPYTYRTFQAGCYYYSSGYGSTNFYNVPVSQYCNTIQISY